MASYSTMLDNARAALNRMLAGGGVEEWTEGGHRVRVTSPEKMIALIERLESLAADEVGVSNCRPMVEGQPQ